MYILRYNLEHFFQKPSRCVLFLGSILKRNIYTLRFSNFYYFLFFIGADQDASKGIALTYNINNKNHGHLQICRKEFLKILGVSRFRHQNLCKKQLKTGFSPSERRGGYRTSQKLTELKTVVRCYIQKLKCVDSHYGRDKR